MEELLFVDEVAKELRVTRKTIYDWMREGKLDYLVVGGRRRISRQAIVAFMRSGREGEAVPEAGIQTPGLVSSFGYN